MPKDRRANSLSAHRARVSPYACSSKSCDQGSPRSSLPPVGDEKEWEEARCSICMEHPHNAVLLLCSSRENGCRPYMCDTSHRHSNCLDQFRKLSMVGSATDAPEDLLRGAGSTTFAPEDFSMSRGLRHRGRETHMYSQSTRSLGPSPKLLCPLCRGQISGWVVIEPARRYMNSKPRSCSLETCSYTGNYSQLRKHARLEHPSVRPTEADPRRQSEWTRMERQRDFEDTLSAYQSFGDELDEDDLLDDFQLEGSIFDFLGGVHSEAEDEWSDEGNMSMDFEFELDFSFLSDIFFSPSFEAMDLGRPTTGGRFQSQRSTRSTQRSRSWSNYNRERIPARRRDTRTPSRTQNRNLSSSQYHGSWQ